MVTSYEHDITMKSGVVLMSETGDADCVTIDGQRQSRVLLCDGVSSSTQIRGFTITRGWANGEYPSYFGGGIYCLDASPVLSNIVLSENEAHYGGGLCNRYASDPELEDVVFLGNVADHGGGMYCWDDESPSLLRVTFDENSADYGGGMYCYASSPTIVNATFARNSAPSGGGLFCTHDASPTITNTIIAFGEVGRAIQCYGRGIPTVTQSIIFENAGGDTLCTDLGDNLIVDPLFCGVMTGDLSLCGNSPCLPGGNFWGELVGAFPEGCGSCDSPVEHTTWGTIKAMFR